MNVEEIYRQFTVGSRDNAVRAGWVERYLESPITFWCGLFAPEDAKEPMTDFQQHLFDIGNSHQEVVNNRMYPGGIQEVFTNEEEGFRRSLEVMAAGSQLIKNMPLVSWPDGLTGRPDVLERVDGIPSVFGDFSYRIVEVKSSRRLRDSQKLQAGLYNRVLGLIQGYEPPEYQMVNRDFEVVSVVMAEVDERLDKVLKEIREIIAGKPVDFCYGVAGWPWTTYVDQQAIANNDVSLITGVGSAVRLNLVDAGYKTIKSVARANEADLVSISRIGPANAKKMVLSAQALDENRPLRREDLGVLRRGATEVFFDFEGAQDHDLVDGQELVNYLIGAVYRTPGLDAKYIPFFADTFGEEGENLAEFLEWANSLEDPVFYHWHHYERTHLMKMVERHGLDQHISDRVLDRLEDLSPWTTKGFAFPTYGESLKSIARCLGFSWRQTDVSGVGSMDLYLKYIESGSTDDTSKQKIIIYNEDDCFATMHIYDWVMSQENGVIRPSTNLG